MEKMELPIASIFLLVYHLGVSSGSVIETIVTGPLVSDIFIAGH